MYMSVMDTSGVNNFIESFLLIDVDEFFTELKTGGKALDNTL